MRSLHRGSLACAFTCLFAAAAAPAVAQTPDFLTGQAADEPIVRGAPYSGEGRVTIKATLGDGTRIERSVTAKYYRDSAGRIRREQNIIGLEALDPSSDALGIVTIIDPVAGSIYTIIAGSHEVQRISIDVLTRVGQPPPPPPPPSARGTGNYLYPPPPPAAPAPPKVESLGTGDIEGVSAVGRRTRVTIPTGQMGNDRPIEITDERWESPDLKMVILSRHHDPRTGDIEFRLSNVSRGEPPRELFMVPSDYKIVDISPPPPPPPPARRGR